MLASIRDRRLCEGERRERGSQGGTVQGCWGMTRSLGSQYATFRQERGNCTDSISLIFLTTRDIFFVLHSSPSLWSMIQRWSSVLSEKIGRPDIFSKALAKRNAWNVISPSDASVRVRVLTRTRQVECDFNCSAYLGSRVCAVRREGELGTIHKHQAGNGNIKFFPFNYKDFDFARTDNV